MDNSVIPRIMTPTTSLGVCYPQAHTFQDAQQAAFWTANEVALEKDIQPLMTELGEADKHGILTTLQLFTHYELRADEFWSDVIKGLFPRPEIQEMAQLFGAIELSVHRRVYDKLNQLLFVSNDEYYESYKGNDAMRERMEFMDDHLSDRHHPLVRIAAFAFAEGVILFSNFAFLMSFRANGNNVLPNIGLAVKFSARDEDLHCQASTWLFQTLQHELNELGEDTEQHHQTIYDVAKAVREHEFEIIKEIFSKGSIRGITEIQMQHFVDSRINTVLRRMGMKPLYEVTYNPIATWFNKIVESYQYVDFFAGQGSSYSRGWNQQAFTWKRENNDG